MEEEKGAPVLKKTRARVTKKKYEKREFDPNQPHKKPFFDTKRQVYVVPKPRSGIPASGMPASGMPASGTPARGGDPLGIPRKWDNMFRPPEAVEDQNRLGDALLEWANDDQSRNIKVFAIKQGINPYRFAKVAEKNEYFASCLQMAKELIASRLIENAQTRKEDSSVNMRLLPLFDDDYRNWEIEKRKNEQAHVATQFNITMEPIPNSPIVPPLPVEEKE